MQPHDIPIACNLTQDELPQRQNLLRHIASLTTEVQEKDDGFSYRFASDSVLPELSEIIRAERSCCPFLRFVIDCEPGNGPVWLHLSGPSGTKEFVADLFQLNLH